MNEAPDLDLLADFAAGALDGTPQAAEVAARIATDPDWAELHAALVRADEAVRADLAALPAPTIPSDIAARLDEALAGEERAGRTVVPLRRRKSWALAGSSVAAGIALLAGGVFGYQLMTTDGQRDSGTSTASAPESTKSLADTPAGAEPPKAAAPGSAPELYSGSRTTGTAYRAETLDGQVSALVRATRLESQDSLTGQKASVLGVLSRLASPPALAGCLAALGVDARPLAVDFATFSGSPAAVIVLPGQKAGAADVAIVGPDCGLAGADLKLRSNVTL